MRAYCTIFCAVASLSLAGLAPALAAEPAGNGERPYSCIVHVHSSISDEGRNTMAELSALAKSYGVDAIFLTDNLTYTLTFGMTPLRNVIRASYSLKSVMSIGPKEYLREVDAENKRQSDVLYIPGVEVCPRFYWEGSFFDTNLVCHDHQRNLMALGTGEADLISGIPEACGYVWRKSPVWILVTRLILVLFVAACLALVTVSGLLSRRSGYPVRMIRRSFFLGMILPLFLLMLLINGLASLVPTFQIYGRDPGLSHEKSTLAYLTNHNIVCYWAHPQAFDDQDFSRFRFKIRTDPYPEILAQTDGYNGFGGVYEDSNEMIEPGHEWDQVLMQYVTGKRGLPTWCFGEMLYHYEGQAGKKLNNVESVVWAREKTAESLLASLRAGRFYSRQNSEGQSLLLDRWLVRDTSGRKEVVASVSSRRPGIKVDVKLVRNGSVVKTLTGVPTPVELSYLDERQGVAGGGYYRLLVSGPVPVRLVSNPLFISSTSR